MFSRGVQSGAFEYSPRLTMTRENGRNVLLIRRRSKEKKRSRGNRTLDGLLARNDERRKDKESE